MSAVRSDFLVELRRHTFRATDSGGSANAAHYTVAHSTQDGSEPGGSHSPTDSRFPRGSRSGEATGLGLMVEKKEVFWWVKLSVRPGCLDDFEKLTGDMVTATRAETGVLAYQRFISHDQRAIYVHERYENSDTAARHLRSFAASFGTRYASIVERRRFLVFGDPSDELRTLLDTYGATYHRPFGRFPYWS